MNKITIYIHIIMGGDRGAMKYGVASEIKNYVRDFRGKLPYNSQASSLLALSLINTGTTRGVLYTIIKAANGGRPQDYISCDIFVPAEVKISKDEVVDLLKKAENIISDNELKDEAINSLVSETYETKKALPQFTSSRNDSSYAVRYYGKGTDYSLEDIVESPFQNYYANYGYIILSNKEEGISFSLAKADLTNERMNSFVEIVPAKETRGFILYIDNNKFDHPVSLQEGTKHTLSWKREGYAEVTFHITAKRDLIVPVPRDSELIRHIPLSNFSLIDKNTKKGIASYSYDVDRWEPSSSLGKYIDIKELNFPNAMIRFSADGYKSRKLPLRDAVSDQVISLEECRFVYTIELTINSVSYKGQKVDNHELDWHDLLLPDGFKPANKHLAYGEDQINKATWTYNQPQMYNQAYGYASERGLKGRTGHDGKDRYKKHPFAKNILVGGILLLIVVLFTGLIWPGWMSKKSPKVDTTDTTTYVNTRAIDYLDTHKAWKKDTLQKFQLGRLYDNMVNFRFENLQKPDRYNLSSSKEYLKLVKAVKEAQKKGIVAPNGKLYSANGDSITIDKYIKYIKNKANFVQESHLEKQEKPDFDLNDASSTEPSTDNHQSQSSTLSENKNNRTNNSSRSNTSRSKRSQNGQNQDASINGAGR